MLEGETRFHLNPISERFSLASLEQHEYEYIQNNRHDLEARSPHPNLGLVVVIPALNEKDEIGRVLQSLSFQNLPQDQFEVIVVDNGSTDGTQSVVHNFTRNCGLPVHLVTESIKGCLRTLRTGMDIAMQRLAQISSPNKGIIATIDADDQVSPHWAETVIEIITEKKADMIRGQTKLTQPLPSQVELCVKTLCDVENRINGYAELTRLRLKEALLGIRRQAQPLWLPRITGPNIAISRAAYIAVGGLDPRPPGDQASHLANPLLRMGGIFKMCNNPRMILFRSNRRSFRNIDEARGFGVGFGLGFGDMLSLATESIEKSTEIDYPNPARVEAGLKRVLVDLQSEVVETRQEAKELVMQFLDSPPDPNVLYRYGSSPEIPARVSISEAKAMLINMALRAGGIDYQLAERFLMSREFLRTQVLSFEEQWIQSNYFINTIINGMGRSSTNITPHYQQITGVLKRIPSAEKEKWYDTACRELEGFYAQVTPL